MARCVLVSEEASERTEPATPRNHVAVGEALPDLDQRLSDELDRVNAAATKGTAPARELTVQILDDADELAAGMSGWTWGEAAGIGLTWVRYREIFRWECVPTQDAADVHFRKDL
jgi:hypothetical protein